MEHIIVGGADSRHHGLPGTHHLSCLSVAAPPVTEIVAEGRSAGAWHAAFLAAQCETSGPLLLACLCIYDASMSIMPVQASATSIVESLMHHLLSACMDDLSCCKMCTPAVSQPGHAPETAQ